MNKILHVFYSFLPDVSGSSIRSAGLLSGLVAQRVSFAAVTSPFQPGFSEQPVEEFGGGRLYRSYRSGFPRISEKGSSLRGRVRKMALFPAFVAFIRRVARAEGATIIHAHSTFYCALAGWIAARSLGLRFVYEFRSLWEERAKHRGAARRVQSGVTRWLETLALHAADRVVTINEALKENIVARGIPAAKVHVVPNAVDDSLIEAGRRMAFPARVTRFGYVGSLSAIEGLDLLVDAFCLAFPEEREVQLQFHGAGAYEQELAALIATKKDSRIRMCGPFPRSAVAEVYRSLDCVVLPRHRTKLNDTVTPLKPLEAMAFKRLVGVSDVGGLLEVIGSDENAWVFPAGDARGLARNLRHVYEGRIDIPGMAACGHAFVCGQRAWSAIAKAYIPIYDATRDIRR